MSDRDCLAIDRARAHGVPAEVMLTADKHSFSDALLAHLQANQIDYVISFFTKLFARNVLQVYQDRILNLHPSLLPAFKGLDGFGDTVRYGARYLGTTIHFIYDNMDEGKIIMQTVCPLDPQLPEKVLRHQVFSQQCISLLQVVRWLAAGRISIIDNRVVIAGSRFLDCQFSPSLDFPEAIKLQV